MNNHDGTFREEALMRGLAVSGDGQAMAGMGIAPGDYDLDGHIDIFRTHYQLQSSGLYRGLGKGQFDDVSNSSGIGAERRFVSWGAWIAGSGQRRLARHLLCHRQRLPGTRTRLRQVSRPQPADPLSQSWQRQIRSWARRQARPWRRAT
jgi:hypothetical protein